MILKHKAELAGRVKLVVSGGSRGTIKTPWFGNMILDQGLNRLLTTLSTTNDNIMLAKFGVGSSSQPVSESDVGLISPIAYRADSSGLTRGWSGEYGWSRGVKTFPRGAAAGNISEVASYWSSANNNNTATARALVKDEMGNPTTITVLPDEVLTMTWEFRRWWTEAASHTIDYTIDGVPQTTTVTYPAIAAYDKSSYGLGTGGDGGFGGSLVSGFTAEVTRNYNENTGNPAIAKANPYSGGLVYGTFPHNYAASAGAETVATFTPPIPKTNEFTCAITWQLTLARRAP